MGLHGLGHEGVPALLGSGVDVGGGAAEDVLTLVVGEPLARRPDLHDALVVVPLDLVALGAHVPLDADDRLRLLDGLEVLVRQRRHDVNAVRLPIDLLGLDVEVPYDSVLPDQQVRRHMIVDGVELVVVVGPPLVHEVIVAMRALLEVQMVRQLSEAIALQVAGRAQAVVRSLLLTALHAEHGNRGTHKL